MAGEVRRNRANGQMNLYHAATSEERDPASAHEHFEKSSAIVQRSAEAHHSDGKAKMPDVDPTGPN